MTLKIMNEVHEEGVVITDESGAVIAVAVNYVVNGKNMRDDHARRIAACVNALEGVHTDRLEIAAECKSGFWGRITVEADERLRRVTAERDLARLALRARRKKLWWQRS